MGDIATFTMAATAACTIDAPASGSNNASGIVIGIAPFMGPITAKADLTLGADGFTQTGNTFAANSFTIHDAGDWSESSTVGGFLGGTGTVDFNSAATQTIHDVNTTFNNLTHSLSGNLILTAGMTPLMLTGNFVNSSGTISAGRASITLTASSGSGNWSDTSSVVNLGTVTFNAPMTNQTIASNSNFNNLTYAGSATLQMLTPLTITGNFTVSSGTFSATTLNMAVAGNWSNSGSIRNTGTVTFNGGAGTTQLLDNGSLGLMNSLKSVIHSGAGTLQLSNNPLVVTATLDNSAGTFEANSLNLSVTGLTTISVGAIQNSGMAADTLTLTGGLSINSATLSTGLGKAVLGAGVTEAGTSSLISGNLDLGGANRTFTINNGTHTISALISNGGLSKSGPGILALSHSNSYSGGTAINAGVLGVITDGALGPGTGGTTVTSGATLDFAAINYATPESVTLNGGTILADNIGSAGATAIFAGPITVGATGSMLRTVLNGSTSTLTLNAPINLGAFNLTVLGPGDVILNRAISGTSAAFLNMLGPGTLTLNGASNYGNSTAVTGGTLLIGNDSAVGTGPLLLSGPATILAAGANHALANLVGLAGAVTIGPGPNTLTLNGVVSDAGGSMGSLMVNGNLTLQGQNTYGGGTTVNNGAALGVGSNSALGSGPLALNNNTAFFASVMAPVPGVFVPNSITLTGSVFFTGPATRPMSIAGDIGGSGSLIDVGSATLGLSGSNSYTGGTTVNAGTLALGNQAALGTGPLTLNNGTTLLATPIPFSSLVVNNPITFNGSTTINVSSNTDLTFAGAMTLNGTTNFVSHSFIFLSGAMSGPGGLSAVGDGLENLFITGNNTYSGATTVNSTFVWVTGSLPNSAVTLNSGGVLLGDGTVGPLTVNGGGGVVPSTLEPPID